MSHPIRGQGGHSVFFSIGPKNINLVEDVEIVSLNSVQRFQRRSQKCLIQSEARAAIFFFPDRPEKHKVGRGR